MFTDLGLIGKKIKQLREEKRLTQQQLADKLNRSRSLIAKWETGDTVIDVITIAELCSFFGVTADYLIGSGARTADPEIKSICEYTHLGENTIKHLHSKRRSTLFYNMVDRYIGNFLGFVEQLIIFSEDIFSSRELTRKCLQHKGISAPIDFLGQPDDMNAQQYRYDVGQFTQRKELSDFETLEYRKFRVTNNFEKMVNDFVVTFCKNNEYTKHCKLYVSKLFKAITDNSATTEAIHEINYEYLQERLNAVDGED